MKQVRDRDRLDAEQQLNPPSPTPQVKLSQIFEWYAADFAPEGAEASEATTLEYVARYLDGERKAALERLVSAKHRGALTFVPYDWGLNAK